MQTILLLFSHGLFLAVDPVGFLSESAGMRWPVLLLMALAALGAVALGAYLMYRWLMKRNRRFQTFFENSPGPTLFLDQDMRVEELNVAARDLLGDDVLGRNFQHVLDHLGQPDWTTMPERAGTGGGVSLEARLEDDDNTRYFQVDLRGFELLGAQRYIATLYDLTEERERVQLFKQFHLQTINQLPIEVAMLTPEGQYIHANEQFAEGLVENDWLLQKTDADLCRKMGWHPEVALRRRSHRKRAMATGERVRLQETLPMPDGSRRHIDRYYAPVFDLNGEAYVVITVGLDRSALVEHRQELERTEKRAEDFDELKQRFLDNLSHEFRTPLTGIQGAAEILQEEVSAEQQELAQIVVRGGRRLFNTLNTMLDLAGLDAEDLDMRPEVIDLSDEVHALVEDMQPKADEKDLFLRLRPSDEEALARLDKSSLQRVLRSLIDNALKFTNEGGVIVEVDASGESVEVRVVDTGVGIRDDFLPHMFDEFEQESTGLERNFEGVGVGLSIAKHLVDRMGGEIAVESKKGEGSMFAVTFPKVFRELGSDDNHRPRLLVAERGADAQQLFKHLLEPHFRVEMAANLEALKKRARIASFDALMLDVNLVEDRAGADVLEELRSFEDFRGLPIVAVDKQGDAGARHQYLATGYDHYLAKPFEKRTLLSVLGDVLAPPVAAHE